MASVFLIIAVLFFIMRLLGFVFMVTDQSSIHFVTGVEC